MTEAELKSALAQYMDAIAALPANKSLGYQGGDVLPLRLGVYLEGSTPDGGIYIADPAEVARGHLAWREWITVRGGKAGGSQAVKPGGGNLLGGIGVAGLLRMITGLPIPQALKVDAPAPGIVTENIQTLLREYLAGKAKARSL